ncbi:MAG: hypothetical protein NC347_15405 [Clostridium sp.]|nr:hypothetical protein [Lachnospiraceae bacterium]MCM1181639.1 hypothetical protein [Clostridium sp.]
MERFRKVFVRYRRPKRMTAVLCRNEQSVGQIFRQTTDADRQTVFADGKHYPRRAPYF